MSIKANLTKYENLILILKFKLHFFKRSLFFTGIILFILFLNSSCHAKNNGFSIIKAFPDLSFDQPVFLTYSPDGTNRIFVVERTGKIMVFNNNSAIKKASVFLDISNKIESGGMEQGLLGLAFHPDFKKNGFFFLNYIAPNPDRTVISRFQANTGKPLNSTEKVILEINQPYANHNGGMIAFGPDRYLYIGTGDGGSGGDPQGNGQNTNTLLGKILRIDINKSSGTNNYVIPADNPFAVKKNMRPEIWATGMRNPWRFSFDSVSGQLWVADVGQNQYEEVDLVEKGKNYGWNTMEGFHCFNISECDKAGFALPLVEYDHRQGISITGGYVYRGKLNQKLTGTYIYGDYGSGKIWSLRKNDTQAGKKVYNSSLIIDSELNISSFGTDQFNELYIVDFNGGIFNIK
jgi:glucose/arabinose dehydrogenase